MTRTITTKAVDGHVFDAVLAEPSGSPRGGLIVLQEIFGVTDYIARCCEEWAALGYRCVAPAIYDRQERGVVLGDSDADHDRAIALRNGIDVDLALADIAACRDHLKEAGKVGMVGYCWGGSLAWVAATRLGGFAAAVPYYGSRIAMFAHEEPRCPVLMYFGETDHVVPIAHADVVRAAGHANVEVVVYPAGHGFDREQHDPANAEAAKQAKQRTTAFLAAALG